MLKRERVILTRGMEIGHRRVARVARLGEKAQVRQPEHPNRPDARFQKRCRPCLPAPRVQEQNQHQQRACRAGQEVDAGPAHVWAYRNSFSNAGVTSSARRSFFPLCSFRNAAASAFLKNGINSLPMGPVTSLPIT